MENIIYSSTVEWIEWPVLAPRLLILEYNYVSTRHSNNITVMYKTFFSDALELPAVFDYSASRYRHHAYHVRFESYS